MKQIDDIQNHGEVVIYQSADGAAKLDVLLQDETVWLTQDQMAALFQRDKSVISRHIKNIYADGELQSDTTVANFATVVNRGYRGEVVEDVAYYNLDMIISVGYRVNSIQGVQFRQWAPQRIREYIVKGFVLDDERLKGNTGGNYWKELLERIRDIRTDERLIYRQVLDLYATSYDYDKTADESKQFFAAYQNKFHFAIHEHTAGELIRERANADEPFMGLRSFKGRQPIKALNAKAKDGLKKK